MNALAYTVLGIIAQASIQPCNEQGNYGTLSAVWWLAEQDTDDVSFEQIQAAITELCDAGLIERVQTSPHSYRLARVPVAVAA